MLFQEVLDVVTDVMVLLIKILSTYIEFVVNLFVNVPKKDVKNHVILITGSGHGLGREMALIFSKLGAKLALIDINQENNERVVEEIRSDGGTAFGYSCDITDEESIAEIAKQIKWDLGEIDILINNAGIVQCLPLESLSSKDIRRTFEVNTLSHFWTIRYFLPKMISRGTGHIVAISSIAGLIGTPHLVDYWYELSFETNNNFCFQTISASKFATVGLMEALETELRLNKSNENIHLTTICPLAMTTGMFKKPKSRFTWIFPVIDAKFVAKQSIDAILRNQTLITVPKSALVFYGLGKIVPIKAKFALQSFFSYGVEPHN